MNWMDEDDEGIETHTNVIVAPSVMKTIAVP